MPSTPEVDLMETREDPMRQIVREGGVTYWLEFLDENLEPQGERGFTAEDACILIPFLKSESGPGDLHLGGITASSQTASLSVQWDVFSDNLRPEEPLTPERLRRIFIEELEDLRDGIDTPTPQRPAEPLGHR